MMKSFKKLLFTNAIILYAVLSVSAQNNALAGAGSTLAYPLLSKIFDDYSRTSKQIINYQANGSGGGMVLLNQKTTDFAVTDLPFNDNFTKKAGGPVVYIPIAVGTIAVAYNVPGVKAQLKLNANVLTAIYSGKITKWNDDGIARLNTGTKLPALKILVAHRSDESGSTSIFIKYFKDDANWAKAMGGTMPNKWPVGTGVKSNQGIAGLIKLTPGAIGYIGLPYAVQYKIPVAALQVKNNFIKAEEPEYPLTGNTGIVVYKQQDYGNRGIDKARQLIKFLQFTVSQAQKSAKTLYYHPLSNTDISNANKAIRSITYNGKNL